jgi:ribonuclease D
VSAVSNDPDAMPAPSRWRDRDPEAAVRLAACKAVVSATAEKWNVVSQNLLAGDVIRRLAWRGVKPATEDAVRERLAALGARPWQQDLLAADLARALAEPAAVVVGDDPAGPEAEDDAFGEPSEADSAPGDADQS